MIGLIFKLEPRNNRFINLIAKFGNLWIVTNGPFNMNCFDGQIGITARPQNNLHKFSNFKLSDVDFNN